MVRITAPINGAILNRHDGKVTADGLNITVCGTCTTGGEVTVNGVQARVQGAEFAAAVRISARETVLRAESAHASDSITVLYDRNSCKRYRLSLDDNVWFLRDIARQRPKTIFDNPYLALWKSLHDSYGTKVNCNIYYQCDGFNLSMMPDCYRNEWRDNAEWFRMTFHALQNEPRDPYINAGYDRVAHDYDVIANEILRFAGEEVMNTFTTIHWGEATVEGCRAVRDRGIVGLCGYFMFRDEQPAVSYYLDAEHTRYLSTHDYWKDMTEDIIFIRHDMVINGVKLPDIEPRLAAVAANPHQRDVMELMIHEQYFYAGYGSHIPEYRERCETAVRWCTENDYRPVFYSEGFLGTPE